MCTDIYVGSRNPIVLIWLITILLPAEIDQLVN